MKQAEVDSKEKELLKGIAKAFAEESSHYQSECDRLSLESNRLLIHIQKVNRDLEKYRTQTEEFINKVRDSVSSSD